MQEPKLLKRITSGTKPRYVDSNDVYVYLTRYVENPETYALFLNDGEGERGQLLTIATVNLVDYSIFPKEGNVIIKDYSENEGVAEFLEKAGVIGPAIRTVVFGYGTGSEHKLLLDGSDEAQD